jgi:hypothetical protein
LAQLAPRTTTAPSNPSFHPVAKPGLNLASRVCFDHGQREGNSMKHLINVAFGLSVLAGGLAISAPARATVWRNFKNENFCLGMQNHSVTNGSPLVVWECDGFTDQNWSAPTPFPTSTDSVWSQIFNQWDPAPPDQSAMCIALGNNGNTNNGSAAISWACNANTPDQGWQLVPAGHDMSSHACYWFLNMSSLLYYHHARVLGASGGVVANGTPIILWDMISNQDQSWCAY